MELNTELFNDGLKQLEEQKGISREAILEALRESLRKAYVKHLGGGEDAIVYVTIETDPAKIEIARGKKVVEQVEDDYLEISLEDALKHDKKLKVGDEYLEYVDVKDLSRLTALAVKSVLRQKINEAEKSALYDLHKDKIGEMITGTVEKCDDRGAMVKIGETSLYITRKDMIGEEMFAPGQPIKLYLDDVSTESKKAQLQITRANPGYIRRVFEEEVREIYDGTVLIKAVAREAGVRSKVAVYSNDPNVDSIGACIGPSGSVIQRILNSLGNAKDREKVDIIPYSKNIGLFIIEALRPATVTKIHLDEANKHAVAIVPDGKLSVAIGRKGANARLACRLTEWSIDIKEEKEEADLGLEFLSIEDLQEEEKARISKEKYDAYLAQIKANRVMPTVETGIEKIKPQNISDDELKEPVKEETVSDEVKEEAKVEEPVNEKPVEVVKAQPKVVKTTTTLESLEKALESEAKKPEFKANNKTKRPHKITEEEVAHEETILEEEKDVKKPQMDIYTQEELAELDAEENLERENDEYYDDDEDIDYDDFDEYYDDER